MIITPTACSRPIEARLWVTLQVDKSLFAHTFFFPIGYSTLMLLLHIECVCRCLPLGLFHYSSVCYPE